MHEALVCVGATKAAEKLEDYIKLYGPGGPPATVAERIKFTTSKGDDSWRHLVTEIDHKHGNWEDITTLAMQYELRNAGQFHKASEIRKILDRPERPSSLNR